MVRQPDAAAHLQFELEAFKELLLLHAIGSLLVNALDGAPVAFSANKAVAKEAFARYLGTGPNEAALPVAPTQSQAVDLELDIPDLAAESHSPQVDNLIDFDVAGITPTPDKRKR
jgi:hypothetical protein